MAAYGLHKMSFLGHAQCKTPTCCGDVLYFKTAYKFGYTTKLYNIEEIIFERDQSMFNKVTSNENNPLNELLPNKRKRLLRKRGHNFILPKVSTERFKNVFINRCLFKLL